MALSSVILELSIYILSDAVILTQLWMPPIVPIKEAEDPTLSHVVDRVELNGTDLKKIRFSSISVRKFSDSPKADSDLESEDLPIVDIRHEESYFSKERYRIFRRSLERIPQTLGRPCLVLEQFESYPNWASEKDLMVESTRYFTAEDAPNFSSDFFSNPDIVSQYSAELIPSVYLVDSRFTVPEDLTFVFDKKTIVKALKEFDSVTKVTIHDDVFAGRPCQRVTILSDSGSSELCICPEAGYALLYYKRTYGDRPGYYREFIVKELSEDRTRLVTCKNDIYDAGPKKVGSTTHTIFSDIATENDLIAIDFEFELAKKIPEGVEVIVQDEEQIGYFWRNGRVEKAIDRELLEQLRKRGR